MESSACTVIRLDYNNSRMNDVKIVTEMGRLMLNNLCVSAT